MPVLAQAEACALLNNSREQNFIEPGFEFGIAYLLRPEW
jgi:hypothetical protein